MLSVFTFWHLYNRCPEGGIWRYRPTLQDHGCTGVGSFLYVWMPPLIFDGCHREFLQLEAMQRHMLSS